MKILKDHIEIEPITNPKKITGTKLSQILGIGTAGMYSSPFQVWCDICRVYTKPFEESKYTTAGKIIEPKQADFIKNKYNLNNLMSPREYIGPVADRLYDYFPNKEIFGGMWDYLSVDLDTHDPRRVIECKTAQTKKRKDWELGIPADYMVQASLYAYLLGIDGITFITTFLNPEDYDDPGKFVCTDNNTIVTQMFISKDYPRFEETIIKPALIWWDRFVKTGESPKFNEYIPEDLEIIKALQAKDPKTENLSLF